MTVPVQILTTLSSSGQIVCNVTDANGKIRKIIVESVADLKAALSTQSAENEVRSAREFNRKQAANAAYVRSTKNSDLGQKYWKNQTEFAARVASFRGNSYDAPEFRNLNLNNLI